jgi:hypothetical protein
VADHENSVPRSGGMDTASPSGSERAPEKLRSRHRRADASPKKKMYEASPHAERSDGASVSLISTTSYIYELPVGVYLIRVHQSDAVSMTLDTVLCTSIFSLLSFNDVDFGDDDDLENVVTECRFGPGGGQAVLNVVNDAGTLFVTAYGLDQRYSILDLVEIDRIDDVLNMSVNHTGFPRE